jgi:hypothetical protein
MIDGVERLPRGEGEGFGRGHADHEASDESGPGRNGDSVEVVEGDVGTAQGVVDGGGEEGDVLSSGDLRNDAAETLVERILVGRNVGEHTPTVGNDGRGGIVARGFNSQEEHERMIVAPGRAVLRAKGKRA